MGKKIDLDAACKAICSYCEMGLPLKDEVHIPKSGGSIEAETNPLYTCRAKELRKLPVEEEDT